MADEAATADGDSDGLIFQWEGRARSRWRLALMMAASLLVHAASFYAFQAAYTPTGTQLPPPAQVVLVPLDRPENAPLAHWLAMNDPALTTRPAAPTAAQVLGALRFRYVPSYDAAQPPFKPLDSAERAVNTVPPRPGLAGPVPVPLPAMPAAPRVQGFGQATQVCFTGAVALPAGVAMPPVRFSVADSANVLDPTVFLVGLRADGGARLLFRQSTSGNAATDEYARGYLADIPLQATTPTDGEMAWGVATFYWGNDVYR